MMSFTKLSVLLPFVATAVNAIHPAFHQRVHHADKLAMQGLEHDGTPMQFSSEVRNQMVDMGATKAPPAPIPEERVTLPLDHFGNDNRTFKNQYWVSDAAYKKGGPVFIYDGGEGDIADSVEFVLQNETAFFKQMVDEFNGIGIVWQHRYYGDSSPFKINLNTPASELQWLTSEQALADVPTFAAQFSREDIDYDLTPKGTPWVFVGGSYPGMRAAFMREKYPDTIFASYASSAPVEARNDMSIYFDPIPKGMRHWGWGNCTADITAAIKHMDDVMEDESAAAALKTKFLGRNANKNTNAEFADALSTIFWYWQSYGVSAGAIGLSSFCDWIETDPTSNKTAPAEGWAPTKGAAYVVNRWSQWAPFAGLVSSSLDTKCEGPKPGNGTAPACNLGKRFADPAAISWTYQYCTEWGFLQSANLGEDQIISKYNSLNHQHYICHRQFTDPSAEQFVPNWPLTEKTNKYFGGWDIRPSNVYWSGGQFDPWRTLSPLSDEPFAPHPEMIQEPPKCGESTGASKIFGYVMADACHCWDFRTYFPGGAQSRNYFKSALKSWLTCFGEGKQ